MAKGTKSMLPESNPETSGSSCRCQVSEKGTTSVSVNMLLFLSRTSPSWFQSISFSRLTKAIRGDAL